MRFLVIGENFPWPANGGGLIRLAGAIAALAELGEVDLFALCDHRRTDRTVPPGVRLARTMTTPYPVASHPLRWRASWLLRPGEPLEVVMRRSDREPRQALSTFAAPPYDLVWFSTAATYAWCGRSDLGTTIVDLVDLEDEKERQRADILQAQTRGRGRLAALRASFAVAQARRNAKGWRALQRRVASEVDRVLLCTDLDVARLGLPNADVIGNTYERPSNLADHQPVRDPPTLLFQGMLNYAPNADAARWLVEEIAPRLRSRVPRAEIRLVGHPNPGVERLHDPPRVTVAGRVPAMEPELARADLAVVPLRYASGSRVKILESFAHRIPVVSTPIGAEGLEVRDGVHILLAEGPEAFAAACERLLTDPELRARLVDAAEARYLERYQWSEARDRIRALVHDTVGDGNRS